MPIVDDPYDFGRIAAANSLSDIYAMGGKPVCALAILGLPLAKLGVEVGAKIMAGGAAVCAEAGIQIVGGHSIDDAEPKFGLSVTGVVHPDKLWRNSGGQVGDVLVLTKALGSGTLTSGIKQGAVSAAVAANVIESMVSLNKAAADVAATVGVRAATDVTGFSLLGHAIEMAHGAGLGLEIDVSALPVLDGAWETLALGIAPGATGRNLAHFGASVEWAPSISDVQKQLLGDPQTSGGLLFAVAPEKAQFLVDGLRAAGVAAASMIGSLVAEGFQVN